jgi:hypothetical protein
MPTVPPSFTRLAILAVVIAAPASRLIAADFNWLNADGMWNQMVNWQEGLVPVSGLTTDLLFGGSAAAGYTSTNDLPAPFQLNTLTFKNTGSAGVIIDGADLSFLTDNTGPTITHNGSYSVSIKNNVFLGPTHRLTLVNNGTGTVSLDGVISGGEPVATGGGYLIVDEGKWRLTNSANSYVGGTLIRPGAVLELLAAGPSPQSNYLDRFSVSLLGNASGNESENRVVMNGGTLRVLTSGIGAISVGMNRQITFSTNGGTIEMLNTNADDPMVQGGHILSGEFALVINNPNGPAVFAFNGGQLGLSSIAIPTSGIWNSGENALRFSNFNVVTPGTLRVELSNGAMVRAGTSAGGLGSEAVDIPFVVRGVVGGDPTSGPDGTVNTGTTRNVGRVVLDRSAEITYSRSFTFQGALQVSPVGRSRSLNGNLVVAGTSSGTPGYVSFTGRGATTELNDIVNPPSIDTTGQNVLWLLRNGTTPSPTPGDSPGGTLTIQDGGLAVFDTHMRSDEGATNGNGVALDGLTILNAGSELRILQSVSIFTPSIGSNTHNTGDVIIYGDIRSEGTTARESVLNIYLPEPQEGALVESTIPFTLTGTATTPAAERPYGGVRFDDSRGLADLIVNGSEFGGLKITASPRPSALLNAAVVLTDPVTTLAKVAPVASATRLSRLTGTGGYLTVATPAQTWPFPAGGEWASAVPVGLKVTDHNALGADVSFAGISTFVHSIALDGGTLEVGTGPLLFGPASAANGLGQLQGNGTISGPTTLAGGANVSPGFGIGIINTGNLSFMNGAKLTLEIQGLTPGSGFDQLQVTGTLSLDGSVSLVLTLGFNPVDFTDTFVIIQNDGADPVQGSGKFAVGSTPLPEGALFDLPYPGGTQAMRLSYVGGDGNDVTIRAVPEPGTAVFAVVGVGALLGMRRRRRIEAPVATAQGIR